jgi:hypothetical protein
LNFFDVDLLEFEENILKGKLLEDIFEYFLRKTSWKFTLSQSPFPKLTRF